MKYSVILLSIMSVSVFTIVGMQYEIEQKRLVSNAHASYVFALNKAFRQGNGKEILRLYRLEPQLLEDLRHSVNEQERYTAWGREVLSHAESKHGGTQQCSGRVQHNSHPVVQARGVRAKL